MPRPQRAGGMRLVEVGLNGERAIADGHECQKDPRQQQPMRRHCSPPPDGSICRQPNKARAAGAMDRSPEVKGARFVAAHRRLRYPPAPGY